MKRLCRVLGVRRSGFHDWLRRGQPARDPDRQELLEWVEDLAKVSGYTYGSRRMAKAPRDLG